MKPPVSSMKPSMRWSIALVLLCTALFAGQSTLHAQGSSTTGVPIKIWAQAQAGTYYSSGYVFEGWWPVETVSFLSGATRYYLCLNDGGVAKLPSGQVVGPYPGLTSNNQTVYPYYTLSATSQPYLWLYGTFHPSSPTLAGSPPTNLVLASYSNQYLNAALGVNGLVHVEPGQTYSVGSFSNNLLPGAALNISVPPQYRVVMNGVPRNRCDLADTITFTVIPRNEGPPGAAGFASSVATNRVDWRLALGTLRNGDDAGALRLLDFSLGASWEALFTPAALNYEATSDEIFVRRVDDIIEQIIGNQVAVDINVLTATSYQIRCFHPSQVVPAVGAARSTFTGLPFAVYLIAQGATPTSISFTKSTRDITDLAANPTVEPPFTRVEKMTLVRTGDWPNHLWTKTDWFDSTQSALVSSTVQNSGTVDAAGNAISRTEAVAVKSQTGLADLTLARSFAGSTAGEILESETLGSATGLTTAFSYYTNPAQSWSYGYVKSVTIPGGGWEAYDYNPQSGRIQNRYRPYGQAPATPTFDPTKGEVTSYTYSADPSGWLSRPGTISTRINNKLTAQTVFTYDDTNGGANNGIVVSTRKDFASGSTFLTTVTKSYWEKTTDAFLRNKPVSIVQPGAVKQSFAYQRGTWDTGTFTAGAEPNTASRIAVILGSATPSAGSYQNSENGFALDPLYLVDGKSTKNVTFRDGRALVVRTESHVWKNSAWQLVSFVDFTYNNTGLLISRVASNGATYTATYIGQLKMSETDESGVTTAYAYDAAARVMQNTRSGATGGTPAVTIPPVITGFTYDATGNVLTQRVGPLSGENLLTTRSYDSAGRLLTEKPPGLDAVSHSYDAAARTHTVTTPDGATTIDTKNIDGRPASRTGTAVVAQFMSYEVDPDGRQWTRVNTGTATSPRWQKSWKDWLGRETRSERPSFTGQANYVETKVYDPATGRLASSAATGVAASLFVYDALGRAIRTGLDVTGNGTLDLASADRISESDQTIEFLDDAWWARSETRQYAQVASATPTVMSVTRQRLTNFSPAGRVGETRSTDFNGNVTTVTTDVDRAAGTAVTTTTTTGITTARLETKVAGLTISVRGHDNLTTRTGYDALLRPVTRLDSRNNTTTTAYQTGSSLVASITDATNTIVAQTTYDTMGRPIAQEGAPDFAVSPTAPPRHTTRTSYTLRGQPERQWGDAALPVSYTYDATYGDRLTLSTYRAGTGWSGATWPTATTGTADTTTWAYDAPSGLLVSKTDAAGALVGYTYNARSQLTRRTWARGTTTDYTYDFATAEQRDITYSDGTPELHYTYNRLAQTTQIDDATGSHLLTHCICGKLESERFDLFFYGNRLLTYSLNANSALGPLGRTTGFTLTTASSATEQTVAYGYDPTNTRARLTQVTSAVTGVAAASHSFNYAYLTNSDLIEQLSVDSGSTYLVTRTFEAQRDVLTSIDSTWGSGSGTSRARYDYVTDALGQRTSVKQNGSAFADYYDVGATNKGIFQSFAYDARGQLTANPAYLEDAADDTKKLPRRQHEFAYDNIGNRTSSNRTGTPGDAETYTANALNQYIARDHKTSPLSGTAKAAANVVVAGPTAPVLADRRGRYWAADFTAPNGPPTTPGTQPWRGPLDLYFGQAGAGTSGADLVRFDTRMAQIPARVQVMTYDADGNIRNDGIWSYTWDGENRLIQLTTVAAPSTGYPQITLKFRYDYLGRRVEKLVIDTVSNRLISGRRFLYDGWNLIAEYSLNAQLSTLTVVRSYTWGLDIARTMTDAGGVGALLQIADHPSGKTYFPAYDGNGNITALVNSSTGAVAAAYEYSPFGEQIRADVPDSVVADQAFRFSTKYTDSETGLVYYGRRYYDPKTGRFPSRDPIDEKGGTNLYAIVWNNPINKWDYLGMCGGPGQSPCMMAPFVVNATPLQTFSGGAGYYGGWDTGFDYGGWNTSSDSGQEAPVSVPTLDPKGCAGLAANYRSALAALAAYVDHSGETPPGMIKASLGDLPSALAPITNGTAASGISASVFQDINTGAYMVSFRGTEPSDKRDIRSDAVNAFGGRDAQYLDAIAFAQQFTTIYGSNVTFTGHSLGGGLAAAAALTTNLPAVTFNAAGVGSGLSLPMANAQTLITNYHTVLDPVTVGQNNAGSIGRALFGPIVGTLVGGIVRTAPGQQVTVPAAKLISERHSMDNMVTNLKAMYANQGCGDL